MSGGSQHNPNGRQPQLGAGWSPLQMANLLARAPQAHMADRGVTWHTPTPPPHLYHVPAPSPPDPLQAMKASGNSVFRHTATPPELYRHTPTPPDKHHMRHTPSPGDVKASGAIPPAELYPHLGPGRDKLVRPEEILAYARGVDLSVGARNANGAPPAPAPTAPALSVRDAPTINSLIARAQPRAGVARVDSLLERLSSPAPPSPSVIVHPRAPHTPTPTPSPPSENEDSTDSCGAATGSKRKRKPERTTRMPTAPPPRAPTPPPRAPHSPPPNPPTLPTANGDCPNGPEVKIEESNQDNQDNDSKTDMEIDQPLPEEPKIIESVHSEPEPPVRRKGRASSETIDDIAAMIAGEKVGHEGERGVAGEGEGEEEPPVSIDKLKSVLASPDTTLPPAIEKVQQIEEPKKSPPKTDEIEKEKPPEPIVEAAAAPKRSPRASNSESTNVPVESPSEGKPAEPDEGRSAEPTAASFVEVENQLEKMFAGIEEVPEDSKQIEESSKPKKRRKSAPSKGESKPGRRTARASTADRRRGGKKGAGAGGAAAGGRGRHRGDREGYDSGSNASSGRSRGPYIQIRGPRDSPISVCVVNAGGGGGGAGEGPDEAEGGAGGARRKAQGGEEFRNGLRRRGLHASTLGLRYDATTPDATWLCAFCERGPHAAGLGDLFGPYTVHTDCDEYRSLDEATRRRYGGAAGGGGGGGADGGEVWFHEQCAVWAPGLVGAGARLWGLPGAVWGARGARCPHCHKPGAGVACHYRNCRARTHVPCAAGWLLDEAEFRSWCARHRPPPAPPAPPPPPPPA